MKTKNYKRMMGVTIFASLLCAASIVWIITQSYFISTQSGEGCIHWHEELYPVQMVIFIGRLLFKTSFYALIMIFLAKQERLLGCHRHNISIICHIYLLSKIKTTSYYLYRITQKKQSQ